MKLIIAMLVCAVIAVAWRFVDDWQDDRRAVRQEKREAEIRAMVNAMVDDYLWSIETRRKQQEHGVTPISSKTSNRAA
jgi:type II secretory pathway component PulJ